MGQFLEYIKMALDNIRSNKGRSFLTMLGIIIGITSVVTIVSIGNGLKADVINASNEQNNTVTILANAEELFDTAVITAEDISYLKSSLGSYVQAVYAGQEAGCRITTRKGNFDTLASYVVPDFLYAQNSSPLVKGSYITDADVLSANPVCVIDELTAMYLFGNTNVLGMDIEISSDSSIITANIIGIRQTTAEMMEAEKQYQMLGMEKSISVELPYTLEASLGKGIDAFTFVSLVVTDKDQLSRIAQTATRLLSSRHASLGDQAFIPQKAVDFSDFLGPIMDGVTAFVALVASISLVVGGIGVMNIMLVSVTERTREIGIRKALGAKTRSIVAQFLCESAIIAGLGGIIGIIFGAGLTALITALGIGGIKAHLSFPAVVVATIFSCSVGIVFGIYPARKAARLSPIEALRRM